LLAAAILTALGPFALAQNSTSITQPLSPTSLNVFNFGPHSFKVQYPPGTEFSGIKMTVVAEQLSPSAFSHRVQNTRFYKAACDIYGGEAANCIDYLVTCSNGENQPIACPSTTAAHIAVETSFNSNQEIVNPGFLTTPIGQNAWMNILDAFFEMRIDPTAHGHTNGFSEFVAVALGATDAQGLGNFVFEPPLQSQEPRSFADGSSLPVAFTLSSAANPPEPVTDATAGLTVLMVANAQNQPVSEAAFAQQIAFAYEGGAYRFNLSTKKFARGTYVLTIFGDAFASQATTFTLH
jgi:hypothetical protein